MSVRPAPTYEIRCRQGGPRVAHARAGELGLRIIQRLRDVGMSQNQLAERAGLPDGYVSRLIASDRGHRIKPVWVFSIARVLGCRPEWLWLGEGEPR